jgi:hypothetical protein
MGWSALPHVAIAKVTAQVFVSTLVAPALLSSFDSISIFSAAFFSMQKRLPPTP